ncbi:MAG: sugar phosphate isomerase/epimerase family protein [Bacteroidia bacterium]|nr:sugar phosphate isomerase/epimerase family protein [Bacteroidia bacterium]
MNKPALNRLCIHTITTKPWSLEKAVENYLAAGVTGISVWQDAAAAMGFLKAGELLKSSGMQVVSYVRGGFFPHLELSERQKAIDQNLRLLDEAAAVGAPMLVLVCGAAPGQSLDTSRAQIQAGIEALIPHAESRGVKLAIEPLHPMYADTRSAINTLTSANDMAEAINSPFVGIAVDVYHLWWEPGLETQIQRCGANQHLFAFHICDWKVPTEDFLNDRGLMGEGCIPVKQIRQWVENTGFSGFCEVEIFSHRYWAMDQHIFLNNIIHAYQNYS